METAPWHARTRDSISLKLEDASGQPWHKRLQGRPGSGSQGSLVALAKVQVTPPRIPR